MILLYNLGRDWKAGFFGGWIELRLRMGTPESLGTFTDVNADLQISGMFSAVDGGRFSPIAAPDQIRREYEYID